MLSKPATNSEYAKQAYANYSDGEKNVEEMQERLAAMRMTHPSLFRAKPIVKWTVDNPKVGRNEPCPCGSGKKYKNCCGKNK